MLQAESARQPVFDPHNVGASLGAIQEHLPIRSTLMNGILGGEFMSSRRGSGYEVNGIRDYEMGDDYRHVDPWATARHPEQTLQVRDHYQDISPTLWIVTDILQDRHRVTPDTSQQLLGISVIMALHRIAQLQGMPTAVIGAGDNAVYHIPRQPSQGRSRLLRTAQELAAISLVEGRENETTSYLSDVIRYAGKKSSEGVIALVTDFRDVDRPNDQHGWKDPLQRLLAKKNQVIAVELNNKDQFSLPDKVDRLTGPRGETIRLGSRRFRRQVMANFVANALAQQAAIDEALASLGVSHIKLSTSDPRWLDSFRSQLRVLEKRKA